MCYALLCTVDCEIVHFKVSKKLPGTHKTINIYSAIVIMHEHGSPCVLTQTSYGSRVHEVRKHGKQNSLRYVVYTTWLIKLWNQTCAKTNLSHKKTRQF